mmetsp:Transcript_42306/g.78301  ORF Transcript_42306/g.78301 Transcript_42306/m.78301 type:complete len:245 (-) Transcript_42306:205-939(-)
MQLKKFFKGSLKGKSKGGGKRDEEATVAQTEAPSPTPAEIVMRPPVNCDWEGDGVDDMSTLAEPTGMAGVMEITDDDMSSYNRAPSVMTTGDSSMISGGFTLGAETTGYSSAGMTLGGDTHTLGGDTNTIGDSTYLSFANGNRSIFSQDSFLGPSYMNLREEVLVIMAPPGKLGISLDTPETGAPFVYSIKDVSPLIGKLMEGDRVIAIDDEDVRLLTAVKISKILSKKSGNTRKLTIARTIES